MQNAIGLIGQAASAFAQNLAQEAKHATDSKHAASLAVAKAQHAAQLRAAKAKAAAAVAAAAQNEGEGAENLVTGAAVSLTSVKSQCFFKLYTFHWVQDASHPSVRARLLNIYVIICSYVHVYRLEMKKTQSCTPTTGLPGLLTAGLILTPLSKQPLLLESVLPNQSICITCR